ncbi:sigma-54 interaction domain-containing protein [Novipirellula artificiosorum]|uniref:Nitrogen fixation protein VnfA n=1 Tax=Novipirellula artificiosorum TaxID=2528016 RepID=A0A5C6DBL7_9BACT|nr:sigma-54-dependent Fis family transcriptional regulator [Novipirellula artificiosorum]TWU32586.1 Nitrogen fixation protein VnfA [Novipirellula artificiosorum]
MTHGQNLPYPDEVGPDGIEVRLSLEIFKTLQSNFSRSEFLVSAIPGVLQSMGSQVGGLVCQRRGKWDRECWVGEKTPFPDDLVSEALDNGLPTCNEEWFAAPLDAGHLSDDDLPDPSVSASALVFRLASRDGSVDSSRASSRVRSAANLLAGALDRIDSHDRHVRRIEQLSMVLKAAAQWQQIGEDETLLECIANTATRLLRCERASIFLWDRRRSKLIGRPALGVEGRSLEVDDDAGVVGEVLRTGEAKIWSFSSRDDERRVNRSVDESLDFKTRSLVAVPMVSRPVGEQREETIGVFEAINHVDGEFDSLDMSVLSDLALHAAVAIESLRTRQSLRESRDRLVSDAASASPLLGSHRSIEMIRNSAKKVAATDLNVLVLGSNGTGKEVLARQVHYESKRRHGPFIAVNCAALVESLLESELFGHEQGAFTDAQQTRIGKFELAKGGTLFLDEVGDLSAGGQAKLLRVLEDKVVVRVGGATAIPVDVRVIAATNQPLEQRIAEKRFREDLFFRLNVVSLTLPPLSQRGSDVIELAEHFLAQFCYQIGRPVPTLDDTARQALLSHAWPGNIRELRNTIERVSYLCVEQTIEADDLMLNGPTGARAPRGSDSAFLASLPHTLGEATRDFQVAHIERAIDMSGGNMTAAAERLGLHRSNLYRKMRQLGMPTSASEAADENDLG